MENLFSTLHTCFNLFPFEKSILWMLVSQDFNIKSDAEETHFIQLFPILSSLQITDKGKSNRRLDSPHHQLRHI